MGPSPPLPQPHVLGEQQPLRGLPLSLVSLAGSGNYSRCSCAVTVDTAVLTLAAIVRERSPVTVRSNIHHYTTVQYSIVLYTGCPESLTFVTRSSLRLESVSR